MPRQFRVSCHHLLSLRYVTCSQQHPISVRNSVVESRGWLKSVLPKLWCAGIFKVVGELLQLTYKFAKTFFLVSAIKSALKWRRPFFGLLEWWWLLEPCWVWMWPTGRKGCRPLWYTNAVQKLKMVRV